ncbi:MAG: transposase [Nitrospirae bacterium]|nr:transposase [Nitrospirota bacterium]
MRAKDLKVCRAWAIKENLRHLWDYRHAAFMRNYFKRWYFWATHSRLEPIKKVAKTIKSHIDNIKPCSKPWENGKLLYWY